MEELERRQDEALKAIRASLSVADDEDGAALFVAHHLEVLDEDYWLKHLHTAEPDSASVLDLLVFAGHWSDDDDAGMDTLDFTLPDDATDYVVSVYFDENGKVAGVEMES